MICKARIYGRIDDLAYLHIKDEEGKTVCLEEF